MFTRGSRFRRLLVGGGAGLMIGVGLAGCGKSPVVEAPNGEGAPAAVAAPTPGDGAGASATAQPVGQQGASAPAAVDARYTQPFDKAAVTEEIPEGQHLPPPVTLAGKPTGPLRLEVERRWPEIRLVGDDGKPIPYTITLDTTQGPIEIALRPDLAPNHVRNFIALVESGYYDGLLFDRVVHQEADDGNGMVSRIDLVKAGCPLGTGDEGVGHVGYFMRPELSKEAKHEEGTVGFWRDDNEETACCRFYITLGPAPLLDGQFTVVGKVKHGMDAVKRIAASPVQDPEAYPERERPASPTAIKKATVRRE